MNKLNVGLIGFGTVGTGVVRLLQENSTLIRKKTGLKIHLKKVMDRDITAPRDVKIDPQILTTNVDDVVLNPEIDVVIELIGGCEAAKDYILSALKNKKHVVTANKALLAEYGEDILKTASENNVQLRYEGSVGAGVPIINTLKEGLVANNIRLIFGIINGTTNYILTKMSEERREFGEALQEAKRKGFAEADPRLDIEGIDAVHKLAILCTLAFGTKVDVKDIYKEGISSLTLQDIEHAKEFGYAIKLLAIGKETDGEIEVRVHPTMIPLTHPLASVRYEYNAIYIQGDAVGEIMLYGKGAGQMPAASAIVSDIIELAMRVDRSLVRGGSLFWGGKRIKKMEEIESRYYLRFPIIDRPGIIGKIATILGDYQINITSVKASLVAGERDLGNVEILTHKAREKSVIAALNEINPLPIMRGKSVLIRIEDNSE